MRYVGIIKTGNDEISSERLLSVSEVQRIIPGKLGNRLITGTILNPSKIRGLLVFFYSQNREAQGIRLDPQQRLVIKNQPCDRLILTRPANESQAFFDYTLRVFETDSDQELMVFLSDSVLEIDTESDNSIAYAEGSIFRAVINGEPNPIPIGFSNPGTEEIYDRITVTGSTALATTAVTDYSLVWSLLEQGIQSGNTVRFHGSRITSFQTILTLLWDWEIIPRETSLENVNLVMGFTLQGGVLPNYPFILTARVRALRSIDAIIYDGGALPATYGGAGPEEIKA